MKILNQDKNLTRKILEEASIRVPRGRPAYSLSEALEIQEELQLPLAVKPIDSTNGRGVSLNVRTNKEMEEAFYLAQRHSNIVMIEEYIKGSDYRVLIINGKIAKASERIGSVDKKVDVHPEIIAMCERAAKIVGLNICTIDIMAEDISIPLIAQSGGIIEVHAGV